MSAKFPSLHDCGCKRFPSLMHVWINIVKTNLKDHFADGKQRKKEKEKKGTTKKSNVHVSQPCLCLYIDSIYNELLYGWRWKSIWFNCKCRPLPCVAANSVGCVRNMGSHWMLLTRSLLSDYKNGRPAKCWGRGKRNQEKCMACFS